MGGGCRVAAFCPRRNPNPVVKCKLVELGLVSDGACATRCKSSNARGMTSPPLNELAADADRTRSGGAQGHPLEPLRVSFAGPSASSIKSESKFVDGRTWDSYRILCRPFYDTYIYHICMVTRAVCFGSCYRTRYTRSSHRNSTP